MSTVLAIRQRRGLTLLEAIVVVAIIAVLIALLLPAIQRARAAAARAQCSSKLQQIGFALHNYQGNHGAFPSGISVEDGKAPQLFMSWLTRLLPFAEQSALWEQVLAAYASDPNPNDFWGHEPHRELLARPVSLFWCPAD